MEEHVPETGMVMWVALETGWRWTLPSASHRPRLFPPGRDIPKALVPMENLETEARAEVVASLMAVSTTDKYPQHD